MTETTSTVCHINDLPKKPAALTPCPECPWLESNRDRPCANKDMYSDIGFSKNWRGLAKDGNFFGCHMFDGELVHVPEEGLALGYKPPTDIGARKECAGAVSMIERELLLLMEHDDYDSYIEARPVGLSKRALAILQQRLNGELEPAPRFAPEGHKPEVSDPTDRVIDQSWEWQLGKDGMANIMITMEAIGAPCTCTFCERHATVHPTKTLATVSGEPVEVDEELHGLLQAMNTAGIRTTGSCINFADGLDQLDPGRKPIFARAPEGALNYRDVILGSAAYIRLNNTDVAAQAFLKFAARLPDVKLSQYRIMSQIVFPPARIPQLAELAHKIETATTLIRERKTGEH